MSRIAARAAGLALALPALAAAAGVKLPATRDFTLANGMRVFLVPSREVPLVGYSARVAGGAVEDPKGKEGAAAVLAALLAKGAGTRDAVAFREAVDYVGGSFSTAAAHRYLAVEAEFLAEHAELGLELLADALQRPRLEDGEFEKERGLAVDAVKAGREQPAAVLSTYALAWQLMGHAYARPAGGDERTLAALAPADVRAAAAGQLQPGRTWLVVSGDFEPEAMRARVEARFAGWAARGGGPPVRVAPLPASRPGVLLVDKPDALQTYFRFGGAGIPWSHPDYPARYLANTILGGRFTSRLNTALRIEKGLTYGAGSSFDDDHGGIFSISTYTETKTSKEAIELADAVYRKFLAGGITQAELDSARAYIQGQYAPDHLETASQVADMVLDLAFDGLDRAIVDRLYERLDALTVDEVNRVVAKHFPERALTWVVIGRAAELRPLVRRLGSVAEAKLAGPGFGPGFP